MLSPLLFLGIGAALALVSLSRGNRIRREWDLWLGLYLAGLGAVLILARSLSLPVGNLVLLAFTVGTLGLYLRFSRRQLLRAKAQDPALYRERVESVKGLLWVGAAILVVSLVGAWVFGVEKMRGAWVGGPLMGGIYLWERWNIRSVERAAEKP